MVLFAIGWSVHEVFPIMAARAVDVRVDNDPGFLVRPRTVAELDMRIAAHKCAKREDFVIYGARMRGH